MDWRGAERCTLFHLCSSDARALSSPSMRVMCGARLVLETELLVWSEDMHRFNLCRDNESLSTLSSSAHDVMSNCFTRMCHTLARAVVGSAAARATQVAACSGHPCTTCLWAGPMHIIKQSKEHMACRVFMAACIERPSNQNQHAGSLAAHYKSITQVTHCLWHRPLKLWASKSVLQSIVNSCRPLACKECTAARHMCCSCAHSGQNLCLRMHWVQQFSILRA